MQAPVRRNTRLQKQGGAVAARWAHNPEIRGSSPRPATFGPLLVELEPTAPRDKPPRGDEL